MKGIFMKVMFVLNPYIGDTEMKKSLRNCKLIFSFRGSMGTLSTDYFTCLFPCYWS